MLAEGLRLAKKFGKQSTIKVPCTPEGLCGTISKT